MTETGQAPSFEDPHDVVPDADLSGITDETIFHDAEETILAALRRFAESAGGTDTRRRLFAGDAAQGVALIDLVRTTSTSF